MNFKAFYYRFWPFFHPIRRWEMNCFRPFLRGRVLDAGCGNGSVCRALVQYVDVIDAFDTSSGFIQAAKDYNADSKIRYAVGDTEKIAFADGTFDAVLSISVIGQCDKNKALAELVRVCKTGGTIIITSKTGNIEQLDLKKYVPNCAAGYQYALRHPWVEALFRPFVNFVDWRTLFSFVFYPLFWLDAKFGRGKGNACVLVLHKNAP